MIRVLIVFFLSLQISTYLQAQNLVNNPGFENISCLEDCSNGIVNQKLIADDWWTANYQTPDIFSPCNIIIDPIDSTVLCHRWGVPGNWVGYQYAHAGTNYAGYAAGLIFLKDSAHWYHYRDFPEVELASLLKAGSRYCIGLYISVAVYTGYPQKAGERFFLYAITDQTDVYFSNQRLYVPSINPPPVNPQVILKSENGPYISDTLNWEKVYAPYLASGGERFMTIGNFASRDETILHVMTNMSQAYRDSFTDAAKCYYYIDDVEVIEIPELEAKADTNFIQEGNGVWLYSPTQAEEYTWFKVDTLHSIGNADSIRVDPTETTTYYLKAQQCKLTSYDTVTVTVLPAPLIPVNVSVVNTLTNTDFTIKYMGDNRPELQAELFNSVGQMVRSYTITETVNIGVSDLAAGIYYCRIRKDNVPVLTQKIVIAR
jgi:hypothetical protein